MNQLRDEFDEYFSDYGGVAEEDFVETFNYGSAINSIRQLAQAETDTISKNFADAGINHTVYFDLVKSPAMNAGAATPRKDLSFIAINLGTLLKSRTLLEILLSQAHNPEQRVVTSDVLLLFLRPKTTIEEQWEFLREMGGRSFILNNAFPESLVIIQWALAFDYVYSHEVNHAMLGHPEYARENLQLERLDYESAVQADKQQQMQILELRADYASGIMFGNRFPNKRTLIFPAPHAEKLMVEEYMANAAFAIAVVLSAFSIVWEASITERLFRAGSHPHPEFRFRAISDGILSGLHETASKYSDTWLNYSGYAGKAHCKKAYTKILGLKYEIALQTGPVIYIPKENAPGPHPHTFSGDAEVLYLKLFEQMTQLDKKTRVKAYLS